MSEFLNLSKFHVKIVSSYSTQNNRKTFILNYYNATTCQVMYYEISVLTLSTSWPLLFESEIRQCTHVQTVIMLLIAINRAEHLCTTVLQYCKY